jgi:hypothetical protein
MLNSGAERQQTYDREIQDVQIDPEFQTHRSIDPTENLTRLFQN